MPYPKLWIIRNHFIIIFFDKSVLIVPYIPRLILVPYNSRLLVIFYKFGYASPQKNTFKLQVIQDMGVSIRSFLVLVFLANCNVHWSRNCFDSSSVMLVRKILFQLSLHLAFQNVRILVESRYPFHRQACTFVLKQRI